MREHQLSKELERIRSTYSFNLGLLLTEAFVRKPWKLPLLPFSFIKLNLDFLKNRKAMKKEIEGRTTSLDSNCLLLFSTSEEGVSSLERCSVLARQWQEKDERKVVIITSQPELTPIVPRGAIVYPLTDPKGISKDQRGGWNARCEQLLSNILETHRPANVLFDGPYPYRGVLNLMKIHPHVKTVWRRLETKIPTNKGHIEHFDELDIIGLEFSDFSKPKRPIVFGNEEPKSIFMGLGYDHREGNAKGKNYVLQQLKKKGNHHVIMFEHLQISNKALSPLPVTRWGSSISKLFSENIQFAIVPPNPTLLEPLSMRGIPTVIVCDDSVPTDTIMKLRTRSLTQPISVLMNPDAEEVKVGLAPFLEERIKPPNFIH